MNQQIDDSNVAPVDSAGDIKTAGFHDSPPPRDTRRFLEDSGICPDCLDLSFELDPHVKIYIDEQTYKTGMVTVPEDLVVRLMHPTCLEKHMPTFAWVFRWLEGYRLLEITPAALRVVMHKGTAREPGISGYYAPVDIPLGTLCTYATRWLIIPHEQQEVCYGRQNPQRP